MTDPAAPAPGGYPPPGQTPGSVPGQPPAPGQYPAGQYPAPGQLQPPAQAPGAVPGQPGFPGMDAPAGFPPPPPYGAPPPGATPAPAKKSNVLKIVLIIVAVLVVLCGAIAFFVARAVLNQSFSVGNCIDTLALSDVPIEVDPKVVDCDSSEAQARIVATHDGATAADGQRLCSAAPDAVGYLELRLTNGSTRLLCLAEA